MKEKYALNSVLKLNVLKSTNLVLVSIDGVCAQRNLHLPFIIRKKLNIRKDFFFLLIQPHKEIFAIA